MKYFDSDYMEGAHISILEKLVKTNLEKSAGYGTDEYCESARIKIRQACNKPDADVYFLMGGTQTNATVIDTFLNSYEGVIAAKTGHISIHEAGAIECQGHKVLELEDVDGKLSAKVVGDYLEVFRLDENRGHMVAPGMVYISHPTEYGTLYTKDELQALSKVCMEFNIPLYLDGARLGYGLTANGTDVTLEVIANCCDAFYIGGTKVGALFGEAVVVTNKDKSAHFFTIMKQHGALLAKGRILGIQFDTLFTDNLYLKIAKHANNMAEKMKAGFLANGYKLYIDSPTNQQFIILENEKMKELKKNLSFSFWEKFDETHTIVRFATSWATKEEDVNELINLIKSV